MLPANQLFNTFPPFRSEEYILIDLLLVIELLTFHSKTCKEQNTYIQPIHNNNLSANPKNPFITQLESVKAIGDTVQVIRKAEQTRSQFDEWTSGLEAAAEGRMQDAQKALSSLVPQIAPSISNTAAWVDAAQAVVTRNVDEFVTKASKAAGELEAIQSAKKSIETLKDVENDINAIRTTAVKCATLPKAIQPNEYPGWRQVKSGIDVEAAVEAYKRKVAEPLRAAAECQAIVYRVQRLLP
ncbi:hypothetical protein LTR56_024035 [Elasticomyces elasticus]|nr:hypothetical protein LTR56_024035 [Elasticomyces elasticus]KAK4908441.1 hypothetical protein LTR49_022647 [Elasticomyces elasticus]KAK5743182.1 hypothetical protein LTS12_023955 [Elasticomyces elasticus]